MPQAILLIQPEGTVADGVRSALSAFDPRYEFERIDTCAAGMAALRRHREASAAVAAVVLDLELADSHGIETFDRLLGVAPRIPFLVLGSVHDEALARQVVHRGARDYLPGSRIDGYTLPEALRVMLERAAVAAAPFEDRERARMPLDPIGGAGVTTDAAGRARDDLAGTRPARRVKGLGWRLGAS